MKKINGYQNDTLKNPNSNDLIIRRGAEYDLGNGLRQHNDTIDFYGPDGSVYERLILQSNGVVDEDGTHRPERVERQLKNYINSRPNEHYIKYFPTDEYYKQGGSIKKYSNASGPLITTPTNTSVIPNGGLSTNFPVNNDLLANPFSSPSAITPLFNNQQISATPNINDITSQQIISDPNLFNTWVNNFNAASNAMINLALINPISGLKIDLTSLQPNATANLVNARIGAEDLRRSFTHNWKGRNAAVDQVKDAMRDPKSVNFLTMNNREYRRFKKAFRDDRINGDDGYINQITALNQNTPPESKKQGGIISYARYLNV